MAVEFPPFFWPETSSFLSLNANPLEEREYFLAGQIFAMLLVHGGPGINCLAESCYDTIVKGPGTQNLHMSLNDVPDYELQSSLNRLLDVSDVKEATDIINDAKLDLVFDIAGVLQVIKTTDDLQNVVHKTVDWYVLGRVEPAYNTFREGLQALGVLEAIRKYSSIFHEVFCYTPKMLTATVFETLFQEVMHALDVSNNKLVENQVLSFWQDFLLDKGRRF